ncbi:jg6794 [Pararge aegeria aegeria]|uniref:Jg6794 protein n=3 Tax=Pararge aegeria TaxID=116150 RepID=A0A8S4RRY8_9NEOP|nr:jg6794 [Pararge aegeria aegeria]
MPKATKLHSKGKPNSIQKSCKPDKEGTDGGHPEDSIREFQLQLCWCIQQLEKTLADKKGNEKQLQEAWKVLTVLKNNNQPMIRKRQLMRTHFGDYRAKMAAEEKKLAKMASKIKISESPVQPKATFLRKSALLTSGDSSFTFNFAIPKDLTDDKIIDQNKSCDSVVNNITSNIDSSSTSVAADENKESKLKTDRKNSATFSASGSEFKFNFKVDDA